MPVLEKLTDFYKSSPRWTIIIVMSLAYTLKIIVFNEVSPDRNWNKGDAIFYNFMLTSILEDGDLNLANNHGNLSLTEGHFAQSRFGFPTAKQSPLMAITAIPFRFFFGPVGVLWFNICCSLGIVLLLYELSLFWSDAQVSLIAVLVVGLGSVLFRYAFNFSPDVFSCLLLLGALLAVFREYWWLIGLLFGLSISAKIGNLIPILPVVGYILYRCYQLPIATAIKALLKVGVTSLVTVIPFGIYNYWLFGSFFKTGYQAILSADENGLPIILSHVNDFNLPFFSGLFSLLFNSKNGVVIDNLIVMMLVGFGCFFVPQKNKSKLIVILSIVIVQLSFYATYDHQLASSLGNRFLLFSIALMVVPVSGAIHAILKFIPLKKKQSS